MRTGTRWFAVLGLSLVMGVVASCAPPAPGGGGGPAPIDWSFRGTSLTSIDSQDELRDPIFDACIAIPNCDDEPYLLNIAFRVRIGEPGSAQAEVVTGDSLSGVSEGDGPITLTGGQQATVTWNDLRPLDVLDALNSNNKMDVVGVYTWALEEDTINSVSGGAESVADLFESALNDTLAANTLPGDVNGLLELVFDALFDDIGTPFDLIVSNIPCLGLCDDALGGAVYVGLGATGTLSQAIDATLGSFQVPNINLPLVDIPPDVQGGGVFTTGGTKDFTQTFSGAGGSHRYTFRSAAA